jgi:hypothetical protein
MPLRALAALGSGRLITGIYDERLSDVRRFRAAFARLAVRRVLLPAEADDAGCGCTGHLTRATARAAAPI